MSIFNNSLTLRNQSPVTMWQRQFNDLFSKFNQDLGLGYLENIDFSPRVEIKEKDNKYVVSAEIPGLQESDINVSLEENTLILEGERKTESKDEKEGYYSSEFTYGSFYRAIPLDNEVNADSIKATCKNGILKVEMEKTHPQKHKTKKIPVLKQ
jgi:HSP20 family protein